MQRIKEYSKLLAWQSGLGYLLLWAVALWTLDEGGIVFGQSGVCRPDTAKVLFYWVCDSSSPLTILATVSNFALTATVWGPVFVAAATVDPGALSIAVPIVLVHVVGLPLCLFVLMQLMANALDLMRRTPGHLGPGRSAVGRAGQAAGAMEMSALPTRLTTAGGQGLAGVVAPMGTDGPV